MRSSSTENGWFLRGIQCQRLDLVFRFLRGLFSGVSQRNAACDVPRPGEAAKASQGLGRLAAACAATTEEDDFAVVIFLLELAGEAIGKVMQGDIERGSLNPNDATQVF